MKISIATVVTFAIAASFASAGEDSESSPSPSPSGGRGSGKAGKPGGEGSGSGSGKSGKSGGGTKSGKSGCTDCSADTLTKANTLTSLTFGLFGQEGGVLNQESAIEYCQGGEQSELYLAAVEFTAGCLIHPQCFLQNLIERLTTGAVISEGRFLTGTINQLCEAEQLGEKVPVGGCGVVEACLGVTNTPSTAPSIPPTEAIIPQRN